MRKRFRLRAVLLSAGRGERLRPLSDSIPKALLPVLGRPVAERTLQSLVAAGCETVAINLHHLGSAIRDHFGDEGFGVPLRYSQEQPRALGTLGALVKLRDFIEPADAVLVVNGDSLCRWPLKRLLRRHLRSGSDATLLVSTRVDPEAFGGVVLGASGRALGFRRRSDSMVRESPEGERVRVFLGAQVLSPALLAGRKPVPGDLVGDLYQPLVEGGGELGVVETSRDWHDLGTPARYLEGVLDWAGGRWPGRALRLGRKRWCGRNVALAATARVVRAALETGCRIEGGAEVEESLLLEGVTVGRGCHVRQSILGPAVELPPGTWVERRLVTRLRTGHEPRQLDSVVGGLVYSPMEPASGA